MKIGARVRRLRKLRGLTIEELANNADLTKGFISQLERDITVPSVLNLKQVVEVLGLDLGTFFSEIDENEKNIYQAKDRIIDIDLEDYKVANLIPKLRYLEMNPQLLTLMPLAIYESDYEENEGFGFVVKGKIELTIEAETRTINRGGCFYVFFDNHIRVKNLSKKAAEILWVHY